MIIRKIIVVGCGLHYRSKYHSVLESKGVQIELLIDLKSEKQSIDSFLSGRALQPKQILLLEERYRNQILIQEIEDQLVPFDLRGVDGVLLSTEPKVRKSYAVWAAKRGYHIFLDKPISAFSNLADQSLLGDFEEMNREIEKCGVQAVVSCERRAHLGHLWLKNYIDEWTQKEKIPISGIDIHFAGGVWRTEEEYGLVENHPFKYGYGILLHSGYHFVDLLVSFLSVNFALVGKTTESIYPIASSHDHSGGEVDFMMIGQSIRDNRVISHFSLKLFGTSVSGRKDPSTAEKLSGRMRQESIILHFGHLSSIHLTSYPFKKLQGPQNPVEDFSVVVLNSPLIDTENRVMTLKRGDFSQMFPQVPPNASMNGFARQWQLGEFLEGRDGNSLLSSHKKTVAMLDQIYIQLKKNRPHPLINTADERLLL